MNLKLNFNALMVKSSKDFGNLQVWNRCLNSWPVKADSGEPSTENSMRISYLALGDTSIRLIWVGLNHFCGAVEIWQFKELLLLGEHIN